VSLPLPRASEQRTGVTVSDTRSDARSETMYATPSGMNNLPSMPLR
jgi:hypothetical protein